MNRKKKKTGMTGGKPREKEVKITALKKELWKLCREITRKRYGNVCYTCGRNNLSGSDYQTGHFIAKSICSTELAYSLDNLRVQCSACNIWKSGNWLAFEIHLVLDHGQEYVDNLKKHNRATKGLSYGKDWYTARMAYYKGILEKL